MDNKRLVDRYKRRIRPLEEVYRLAKKRDAEGGAFRSDELWELFGYPDELASPEALRQRKLELNKYMQERGLE